MLFTTVESSVYLVLSIALSIGCAAASTPNACSAMGNKFFGQGTILLSSCQRFWPTGPAIIFPKDTDNVKYGSITISKPSATSPYLFSSFIDRNRKEYVTNMTVPVWLSEEVKTKSAFQIIYTAEFSTSSGDVLSIIPSLFIEEGAMILPYAGLSFKGTLTNMPRFGKALPTGVNQTYWFRWDVGTKLFPATLGGYGVGKRMMLGGTFINLLKPVREGSTCHPALLLNPKDHNSNQTAWFNNTIGSGAGMQFYWSPSMHNFLMDSEIVPMFIDHYNDQVGRAPISYMASTLKPYQLLTRNVRVTGKVFNFIVHGTPQGTLTSYNGRFSKKNAPVHC